MRGCPSIPPLLQLLFSPSSYVAPQQSKLIGVHRDANDCGFRDRKRHRDLDMHLGTLHMGNAYGIEDDPYRGALGTTLGTSLDDPRELCSSRKDHLTILEEDGCETPSRVSMDQVLLSIAPKNHSHEFPAYGVAHGTCRPSHFIEDCPHVHPDVAMNQRVDESTLKP